MNWTAGAWLVNIVLQPVLAFALLVAGVIPPMATGECAPVVEGTARCQSAGAAPCCGCNGACCRQTPDRQRESQALEQVHRGRDVALKCEAADDGPTRAARDLSSRLRNRSGESAVADTPIARHVRIQT